MSRRFAGLALAPLLLVSACAGTDAGAQPSPSSSASLAPSGNTASSSATLSTGAGSSQTGTPTPSAPTCLSLAQGLTLEQQVGQLFMVATSGAVFDPDLRATVRELGIGSVLYLGEPPQGIGAVASMSGRIQTASGEVPILVAVDQEGGQVQRLTGSGFDTIPSASRQAQLSEAELTAGWTRWGRQLHSAGVRYNLAPVVDLVPAGDVETNAPIGQLGRGYGNDAQTVGAKTAAVIDGLHAAGVVTSAKHFPGIGRVQQNTDFAAATDSVTSSSDVQTFTGAIDAGVDSIMVGSVKYDKIDPGVHAVFSTKIVTELLRGTLGWDGVVISDDVGAAQAVSDVPAAERGLRFIQAGGDLVINADASTVDEMVEAVLEEAGSDQGFADTLDDHVARVLDLKARAGLLECSR